MSNSNEAPIIVPLGDYQHITKLVILATALLQTIVLFIVRLAFALALAVLDGLLQGTAQAIDHYHRNILRRYNIQPKEELTTSGKWYTVTVGREVGIFESLAQVQAYTSGVPGNSYVVRSSRAAAEAVYAEAVNNGLVRQVVPLPSIIGPIEPHVNDGLNTELSYASASEMADGNRTDDGELIDDLVDEIEAATVVTVPATEPTVGDPDTEPEEEVPETEPENDLQGAQSQDEVTDTEPDDERLRNCSYGPARDSADIPSTLYPTMGDIPHPVLVGMITDHPALSGQTLSRACRRSPMPADGTVALRRQIVIVNSDTEGSSEDEV